MAIFLIEPIPYQTDRQTPEKRRENNNCHLLSGELVLLPARITGTLKIGDGKFGRIGRVVSESGSTELSYPVKVSLRHATGRETFHEISLRKDVYHIPSNIWTKMMWYDGTLIKREKEEDVMNDPEVENLLSYDSITRTWNGRELTDAGKRRNNRKRGSLGFLANASNPFLVIKNI